MEMGEPAAGGGGGGAAPAAPPPPKKYRLSLRLGDVDQMFPPIGAKTHTDDGVRKRLQAVGFLYENISSGNLAQRAEDAWKHYKSVVNKPKDAAAVAELVRRVRTVVVDYGSLPPKDQFRKIRVPGTYCVLDGEYSFFGSPQAPGAFSYHYQQEQQVWKDNPSLGAIPVIARVYVKEPHKPWKRAPNVHVHFQFDDPAALPANKPINIPALRATTQTLGGLGQNAAAIPNIAFTGSQQSYVTTQKALKPPTGDHLVDNVHASLGGKRGNPVAGNAAANLLETGNARAGFHDKHSITPATPSGSEAVGVTNKDGEAAVVFMPAWTGGDRYKIKAVLQEDNTVTDETGTMVVWRILRLSKYLRWPYPSGTTAGQRNNCFGQLSSFNMSTIAGEYRKAWFDVTVEASAASPQPISIAVWRKAMAYAKTNAVANAPSAWGKAYALDDLMPTKRVFGKHTVVAAGAGAQSVQNIAAFYSIASWRAIWWHRKNAPLRKLRVRENALQVGDTVWIPLGGPHPAVINILNQRQYDLIHTATAAFPAAATPNAGPLWSAYWVDMSDVIEAIIIGLITYFSKNAIGGLTVLQAPAGNAFHVDTPSNYDGSLGYSGLGTTRRGCVVFFGKVAYVGPPMLMPYDHSRNCLHETGHVLYGCHQYTQGQDPVGLNQVPPVYFQSPPVFTGPQQMTGGIYDQHDYHDMCIMGYMKCVGDQCGRCLLNHAGWNVQALAANNPGP
jgi:hypothetical protein